MVAAPHKRSASDPEREREGYGHLRAVGHEDSFGRASLCPFEESDDGPNIPPGKHWDLGWAPMSRVTRPPRRQIVASVLGLVAGAVLVVSFLGHPSGGSASSGDPGCPVGAPCPPPLVLVIQGPAPTYQNVSTPNGSEREIAPFSGLFADILVTFAFHNLTAGDLQFRLENSSGVERQNFTASLADTNGATLATYHSWLSTWSPGQDEIGAVADPFGGWSSGTAVPVVAGDYLNVSIPTPTLSIQAGYWVSGVIDGTVGIFI
jgi:hypothetical protein